MLHFRSPTSLLRAALLCAAAALAPTAAQAQERVIHSIVGFTAGGSADVLARLFSSFLSTELGRPVIVENRAGAGGNIAVDYVVRANPDGDTILFTSGSVLWNPSLYRKLPYDPDKDLQPVARLADAQQMLVVNKTKFPTGTLKDFVEMARKNPGKLNVATSGSGMNEKYFSMLNSVDIVVVPYSGAGDATKALVIGEVDLRSGSPDNLMPAALAGEVRVLAVTGAKRHPKLPDVPTTTEAGMPGYNETGMFGAFVGPRVPKDVVLRLNQALNKAAVNPELIKRLDGLGWTAVTSTPEQFQEFYHEGMAYQKMVVQKTNMPMLD